MIKTVFLQKTRIENLTHIKWLLKELWERTGSLSYGMSFSCPKDTWKATGCQPYADILLEMQVIETYENWNSIEVEVIWSPPALPPIPQAVELPNFIKQ